MVVHVHVEYDDVMDAERRRWRLALVLWLAGILGVVAIAVTLPAPSWVISLAGLVQSALLLGLAVWAGVALAPPVGLRAPVFEAVVTAKPLVPTLRPQLMPGLVAGALGGMLLFAGAGVKDGLVLGATDKQGAYVTRRPVSPADVAYTIYDSLGIDPRKTLTTPDGRPIEVLDQGEPVKELF